MLYTQRNDKAQTSTGDVGVFADNAKLQTNSPEALRKMLDVSMKWGYENGMTWSIRKCPILEPENRAIIASYVLAGSIVDVDESATYLGVTLRHNTTALDSNVGRVKAARKRLNLLRAVGFHRKYLPSATLINIC